jgi:nitrile hydratase
MSERFNSGDPVRVRADHPPGHIRTPFYIRGKVGRVGGVLFWYRNAEERAFGRDGLPEQPVYHVHFEQHRLWPDYQGPERDSLVVDIYEHWLEPASEEELNDG